MEINRSPTIPPLRLPLPRLNPPTVSTIPSKNSHKHRDAIFTETRSKGSSPSEPTSVCFELVQDEVAWEEIRNARRTTPEGRSGDHASELVTVGVTNGHIFCSCIIVSYKFEVFKEPMYVSICGGRGNVKLRKKRGGHSTEYVAGYSGFHDMYLPHFCIRLEGYARTQP